VILKLQNAPEARHLCSSRCSFSWGIQICDYFYCGLLNKGVMRVFWLKG